MKKKVRWRTLYIIFNMITSNINKEAKPVVVNASLFIDYCISVNKQPFSLDYTLASHTTFVVYVNFIHEWRDQKTRTQTLTVAYLLINRRTYSLKSTINDRCLKSYSWQFYLSSELLRESCQRNVFFISYRWTVALRLLMVISFLQRRCYPVTWCIKKIADQLFYNVIYYMRRTEHKY